jgi:hypothetical protein
MAPLFIAQGDNVLLLGDADDLTKVLLPLQ